MNGEEAIVRPQAVLRWRRGTDTPIGALRRAVLVADRGLVEDVRRRRRGTVVSGPSGVLAVVGGGVGIAAPPGIGAPAAAIAVEEIAALDVEAIAALGYAGSLSDDLRAGEVVVLESALRGEGLSRHYLPPAPFVSADPALSAEVRAALGAAGILARPAVAWTTDALYRETPSAVREARAAGAAVVDLEAAATLAVAEARDVAAAVVLVIGDRVAADGWDPPQEPRRVRERLRGVVETLLDAWKRAG